MLPVLQVDHHVARHLGRRLRKVTHRLGAIREMDVLALLIEEIQRSGRYDEQGLLRVSSSVEQERSDARARMMSRVSVPELKRLVAKLTKVADSLRAGGKTQDVSRGWQWAIDARVANRAAKLKRAIEVAGGVYLADRIHQVRIAIKKFRYALELEAEIAKGKPWAADLRKLERAQELLGRLHDLQVLIEKARQVQASLTPPNLVVWRGLDALMIAMEKDCRRLHARYVRDAAVLMALCDRVAARAPVAESRAG